MTKESIKQFLEPNWKKNAVFVVFFGFGWVCFWSILDFSHAASIFLLLPFFIIYEFPSFDFLPHPVFLLIILILIYWYVFSCLLIFLFDILMDSRIKKEK